MLETYFEEENKKQEAQLEKQQKLASVHCCHNVKCVAAEKAGNED